ncbi:MAG: hypothetical protein IH598_09995 [Bacteroidales bacterium]|nr:hypothetical protein [Bacteroidales bacterium]
MNRYVEQLIEDIRKAAANAPQPDDDETEISDEEALARHFDDVEQYLHGEREKLSEIIGIPLNLLPSPGKLTKTQISKLTVELVRLLNVWNFYPDFPNNLPDHMKYAALLGIWESEQVYMNSGETHLEFCDYDPSDCPFPGYCKSCDDFNTDPEESEDDTTDEIEDGWLFPDSNFVVNKPGKDDQDSDEKFITGIFNYCDRWCERCDFTTRCRSFAMELELQKEFEEEALEDENLANDLLEDFNENQDDNISDENPYTLPDDLFKFDELDESDPDSRKDFFSVYQKTERHPLSVLSDEYSQDAGAWLYKHHTEFEKNLIRWLASGHADKISEAFNVLMWYHLFIHIKLKRAINGYYELENFDDVEYDMNGTAKVALISVDRSLDAWRTLKLYFKTGATTIDEFRGQLENIRLMTEEMFPEARHFIRPGLDE